MFVAYINATDLTYQDLYVLIAEVTTPCHIRTLAFYEFQDKILALSFYNIELLHSSKFLAFLSFMSKLPALQEEEVTT